MGRSYSTSLIREDPAPNGPIGLTQIELLKRRNYQNSNYTNKNLFRILRHDDT